MRSNPCCSRLFWFAPGASKVSLKSRSARHLSSKRVNDVNQRVTRVGLILLGLIQSLERRLMDVLQHGNQVLFTDMRIALRGMCFRCWSSHSHLSIRSLNISMATTVPVGASHQNRTG